MFESQRLMFTEFISVSIFSQKTEMKGEPSEDNEESIKKANCIEYKPLETGYIHPENKIEIKKEPDEHLESINNCMNSDGLAKCIENVDVGKHELLAIGDDCKLLSSNNSEICQDDFKIEFKEEEPEVYYPEMRYKSSTATCDSIKINGNDVPIKFPEEKFTYLTNCANKNNKHRRYSCTYCDYKTTTRRLLRIHWKSKHSEEDKEFKCSQCNYETNFKECFNRHLTTHYLSSNKEFKCSQCAYQTNVKSYLNAHMKIKHSEVNRYKCRLCEYQTNRSTNMKQHLSVHDDSKPFGCKVCNKQFKRKTKLEAHAVIHFEEKGFHCAHCDYKSYYKQYLISHLRRKHEFLVTGIDIIKE